MCIRDRADVIRASPPKAPRPTPKKQQVKAPEKEKAKVKKTAAKSLPAPAPMPVAKAKVKAPAPAPSPAPAPAPAPARKDGPIAKAMSGSGRIQTIGPLSFSLATLENCPSKCTLTLRDSSGASMRAVFFKTAYYEVLRSKSGGVFVTGNTRIESGDLTVFIQDIR